MSLKKVAVLKPKPPRKPLPKKAKAHKRPAARKHARRPIAR